MHVHDRLVNPRPRVHMYLRVMQNTERPLSESAVFDTAGCDGDVVVCHTPSSLSPLTLPARPVLSTHLL